MTAWEVAGADLRALRAELAEARARLEDLAREVADQRAGAGDAPARVTLALLAVDLHSYYTLLESLLERAIVALEGRAPEGPASHATLLRHASRAIEGVRPALVSADRQDALDELRRFRHFFRHAYALDLRYDRMRRALDPFPGLHAGLRADLDAVDSFLLRLIDEIASG